MSEPTIVQEETAAHFQISVEDFRSSVRQPAIVNAKHIARYLERELFGRSLTDIGERYGCDHTTVLASVRHMAERLRQNDARYVDAVKQITHAVQARQYRQWAEKSATPIRLRCPTCGSDVVRGLQEQVAELRKQMQEMKNA